MVKYLQRLGKSLMVPIACLPVAGMLMGIGFWINGGDTKFLVGSLLIKAGSILIDNMSILFAVGVAFGMSKDQDGSAGLAGLVAWLTFQTMLSPAVVSMITGAEANAAFGKINNQFIGILCGVIGATCYNKFYQTKLPDFLAFFGGRKSVSIVTTIASLIVAIPLFFVWPAVYSALVAFGESIIDLGAVGAGIYGFLNRLLIPVGLHHAFNSVFWFDVAGINDLAKFWGVMEGGVLGTTGMYMAGFFPVMMFGLPGAALAMYHTAKPEKKKLAGGILMAAALCTFFTGCTEPLEFSFMFLAPVAYLVHAVLTGISVFVVAVVGARAGFNFSAGFVDWFLSFKAPFAVDPWKLILIGLVFFVIYYIVFRFLIIKLNLKTPGREDDDGSEGEMQATISSGNYAELAERILEGLGGSSNIVSVDNCVTRLRVEVKDRLLVDEKKIKSAGVLGVVRPSKTLVQVIVGTQVQFVADEFKKMMV